MSTEKRHFKLHNLFKNPGKDKHFKLSNLFKVGTKPGATRKNNTRGSSDPPPIRVREPSKSKPSGPRTLKNFMNRLKNSGLTEKEQEAIAKSEYNAYLKVKNEVNDEQNIFQGFEKEVLTIEDLNRFIGDNFRDHLTGETDVIGPISKLLGDVCKRPNPPVCNYESMFSSGNGSDCLIHSFLTATCSHFRVLTQEYKNLVARSFRHHLYPTFPSTQRMIAKDPDQHNRRIHTVGTFLNDADLTNILKTYEINFLIFVSPNRDNGNVATALDDIHFPGDVYMIINRGNIHWESVRTEGSSFRISQARAEHIRVAMDQFGPHVKKGGFNLFGLFKSRKKRPESKRGESKKRQIYQPHQFKMHNLNLERPKESKANTLAPLPTARRFKGVGTTVPTVHTTVPTDPTPSDDPIFINNPLRSRLKGVSTAAPSKARTAATPTYVYMGHGADLLIPKPRKFWNESNEWIPARENIVPEGCTYATITETGKYALFASVLNLNKLASDPEYKKLLINPEENEDELAILTTGQNTINPFLHKGKFHLKLAGETYTNRNCDFFLAFPESHKKGHYYMYKSGLYDITKSIDPPLPISAADNDFNIPPEGITRETIAQIYKDSVFPTAKDVISQCNKLTSNNLIQYNILKRAVYMLIDNINQDELFRRFPGNHFNFACRSYDETKPVESKHIELLRRASSKLSRVRPRPGYNAKLRERTNPDDKNLKEFINRYDPDEFFPEIYYMLSKGVMLNDEDKHKIYRTLKAIEKDLRSGDLVREKIPSIYFKYMTLMNNSMKGGRTRRVKS